MRFIYFKWVSLSMLAIVLLFMSSCVTTKNATILNGVNEKTHTSLSTIPESIIQKNDILSITVSSLNPEASAIFNTPNSSVVNVQGSSIAGYLVNADGNIQFPILGNMKAEGMTKEQLKESLTNKLLDRKLLIDPIVAVRFLNFRVTVLGEVGHPMVVSVPSEKISLLEALGLAGDLTLYAKRDNVLLIREENGVKTLKRLNLNSEELLTSPYYYLKSNDVIYVEPNRARVASTSQSQQWIPVVLSGLSLLVIVVDRIVNNN